jgi:hypothetical protein
VVISALASASPNEASTADSLVQMIDALGIVGHRNAALSTSAAEILVSVQREPGRKDSTRSNHVDLCGVETALSDQTALKNR